ncbi:MAG: hypothetical protein O2871_02640 [bacterium]|nr:hypothetical protein [bacterium]
MAEEWVDPLEEEEAFWEELDPRENDDDAESYPVYVPMYATCSTWYAISQEEEKDRAEWQRKMEERHSDECGCGHELQFS